jgi:hypothetical protein
MPLGRKNYVAWSRSVTAERERVGERPLPDATNVAQALALNWDYVERVATRELEVDEARKLFLEELIRNSGPLELLPIQAIAIRRGKSQQWAAHRQRKGDFPPWVAKVGNGHYWYREDLDAFLADRDVAKRERGEANRLIYTSAQIASMTGRTVANIGVLVDARRWHLIPEPAGMAGPYHYWMREDADQWFEDHAE